jgi:hypothetical protein
MSQIQPSNISIGLAPAQLRQGLRELEDTVNALVERVNGLECSCQGESDGEPDTGLPSDIPHRDLLIAGGIETIDLLLAATREDLEALDGIGEAKADDIIEARESL